MGAQPVSESSNQRGERGNRQVLDIRHAITKALHCELLRLADLEDELAAKESMRLQYWAPRTDEFVSHRAAARALRAGAGRLLDPGVEAANFL